MIIFTKKTSLPFLFALLFTSISCTTGFIRPKPPTKAFVKVFHEIEFKCKKKKDCPAGRWRSSGSGVIVNLESNKIKELIVLTAGHVCHSPIKESVLKNTKSVTERLFVQTHTGKIYPAEVVMFTYPDIRGKTGDLCSLRISKIKEDVSKISLSLRPAVIGEKVVSFSAPGGVYHPPVVPIFTGVYAGAINNITGLSSIPAMGGSSGAPVMNENFKLVGLLFAVSVRTNHITLIVNYEPVKRFLMKTKRILLMEKLKL